MATLIPIKGWRYNSRIGDLAAVIAPPYDVIDAAAQQAFYARHEYNIIRLECGMTYPGDDARNNRYTRAAATFNEWRRKGVLTRDDTPALYFYEQIFSLAGEERRRCGFFCGLKLEPYGSTIFPHEETLSAPKNDRLALLRACQANFSPIFALYADPEAVVSQLFSRNEEPTYDFVCDQGQRHRLWVVRDANVISAICKFFIGKPIYIADGHHRFETALQYASERRAVECPAGPAAYDFILALLVNVYDPGLVILPTHRLVKVPPSFALDPFLARLSEYFTVAEIPREKVTAPEGKYGFGLYTRERRAFHLKLREGLDPGELLAVRASVAWKRLAVAVLHVLIIDRCLGIGTADAASGTRVTYTHDPAAACQLVEEGAWDLAFFLNPPQVTEMVAVAESGDRMPQKSTYFYPKVPTGLVIYAF